MRTVGAVHRSVVAVVTGVLVAAGGISIGSTDAGASGSQVVIDTFNPFSGPDNQFGFYEFAGCPPASYWINKAGGILGHPLKCGTVDTRGDPADAVLAAQQMLASTSNLVGVLGPSSDEDTATVPIINSAKVTMFDNGGTIALTKSNYEYFWRTLPADNVSGFALGVVGPHERL